MWKKAEDVALGHASLDEYTQHLQNLESKHPAAIRHILGFKAPTENEIDPAAVDLSVGTHSMPLIIGAMSFGSQGELAYKAYAEAAHRLNILCVNGEGGELPDIMGKYYRNRGQQIASARFGVNIEFLNSACVLEIKVGQGAKPGEGGQLPGYKVTEQVALARSTTPGVALISPSNNHDIYSIEDLAQLIDELKTANPRARVSVKIPVVPGVGIIAVGVAKAGADIINITGYDGGTGAARSHSLRHVGLPTEIGVWMAHRMLTESGLRDDVELWCDGGMKAGSDAVKMVLLGANRVGFATMAMVAMVERTIADDPRFHLSRSSHRLGFYRNFERAIGMVPGEFELIALSDQDDRWYPDKLLTLVEALAEEYASEGIRANAVLPGTVDTEANRRSMPDADHSRWTAPEEIARVMVFLSSDQSAPVNGASIPVYGRS